MASREDETLLRDMLDAGRLALGAIEDKERTDLDSDPILKAALERFLEIIGEAASRLSENARASLAGIPWHEIIGLRNRLIHGYFSIDADVIWAIVNDDLPDFVRRLEIKLS